MIAWVFRLSKWAAIAGGILLVLLTLMIVASVSGRALLDLGLGPVPGDFELVEIGTAIAVFFFLPWTYLRGGHATVDIVYTHLPRWGQRAVMIFCDLLMLILWLVLTQRLWEGMLEKREYFESTFILQMPVWWAYALCLVGAVIGCLAYIAKNLIMLGLASYPAGWPVEEAKEH
jgi:TRAP-type C4-dicarboxylate transport system permease small subunit